MAQRLDTRDRDFEARFTALLGEKRESAADVNDAVAKIIARVREEGDAALIDLTRQFDRLDLNETGIAVSADEVDAARAQVDDATFAALELANARILDHHSRQRPGDDRYTDDRGVDIGQRWTPVASAGLYVPGGTASYPSSVLMNAVPAKVAGVKRLVMVVPSRRGELNPLVLVAAKLAGVDEIYRIGGAQAVAALAFGTETIKPVVKIVGPGNAYVAAAKRQVFGQVGIDMVAGPSEVVVIADAENDPAWIAADLLAQAEHDAAAQSILITDDAAFADAVIEAVESQLATLPRAETARASWDDFGAVILVASLDEAPALADRLAPEHLEIATGNADELTAKVSDAGAIFVGRYTPEVIGDYVAGTNHVLPTARSARFASGLGVLDFMKRTSILKLDADSLKALGPSAMSLARAEGLEAHRRSVSIRLNLPE
ncbi:histidinol dehydrogenase [Methyloceanibacter superfactus]|uniref:Histidinol dehydrogenase n=1 Tax=Methyloceanibacter superfactus TaxID=1774969 RepID=A0A1E3W3L7_9HYPH|nr:histidinol dehydrogenase [Methyloceanibacter superfactus]ODS00405.1 histidinol dehydrogenase [Methyloceanibacter superfactus]